MQKPFFIINSPVSPVMEVLSLYQESESIYALWLTDLQARRLSAIDGIDICSLLYICYAYLGIIVSGRVEEVTLLIYS